MLDITFSKDTGSQLGPPDIGAILIAIKKLYPRKNGNINIRLEAANYLRTLNRKFAKRDESTDVLSFPYAASPGFIGGTEPAELGDIVISRDHTKKYAENFGLSETKVLSMLAVHGILHILGFDHAGPKDNERFRKLEGKVLTESGLTVPALWAHSK